MQWWSTRHSLKCAAMREALEEATREVLAKDDQVPTKD
jgi:hypothetical protein